MYYLHVFVKYGLLPFLIGGFAFGLFLTSFGVYNHFLGRETSGEFTFGLPLLALIVPILFSVIYGSRGLEESRKKYPAEALFWAII